ncbi:GH39 family glycosyl hydrolase [Occallatibacter riparius]|uniref:Glycosyl hydrolase family 39 n=1 Tax=Occallatibacter riparius TaxID=1002689 RepID=A0A9J7BPE6_9BACT|nr:glycosyl hydrolase family 39 [Occallatibacter riparius]UWZ84584.1 glycosyl hydrolase family 39 [Occallatibacter riparius]
MFSSILLAVLSVLPAAAQESKPVLEINWNKTILVSRSTPTLQVVTNPMLNPGAPIHDGSFAALKELGADYVRYVPWLPYPKIAVAELEPPTKEKTSWDFTHIDPVTKDFLAATNGHSTIINFSTIPAWMFKTDQPVKYPDDPNQVFWDYTKGTELRDPTGKELGDYYGRLVSWFTKGGFTDENGKRHESGYHYGFPYWEVLNEVDFEHNTTPEDYTKRYDAIVEGIRKVSPETKFMGLALAAPGSNPKYFEYFLNPKNHKPGIPLDYISFHFYASPALDESLDGWQHTFFNQAAGFITLTRYVIAIRDRLSPYTKIDTDELGVILPTDDFEIRASKALPDHIPHRYWNAAAALYGHLFIELSRLGVDVIGESQLVGYPSQFPSVSMMNYNTGKPNARYWVLKMIKDNFHPGDKLVETGGKAQPSDVSIQGFNTPQGRKVLLVNRTNAEKTIKVAAELQNASTLTVDEESGDEPPRVGTVNGDELKLAPFAVSILSLK